MVLRRIRETIHFDRAAAFRFDRHCEERPRRSNPARAAQAKNLDCFASLAMTN
jgi:hypothetical protein